MRYKKDGSQKLKAATAELLNLSHNLPNGAGFTVLDDKVIIICDKSFANRLLSSRRNKGLPPS